MKDIVKTGTYIYEDELFFQVTRRDRNLLTSQGFRREYKAMESFGIEETTIEYPSPLFLIAYYVRKRSCYNMKKKRPV